MVKVWGVWISGWEWNQLIGLFENKGEAYKFRGLCEEQIKIDDEKPSYFDEHIVTFKGHTYTVRDPDRDDEEPNVYEYEVR